MGSQGKDHLSRSVHCIPPGTTYMSADITKREKLFRIRLVVQYSDKMYMYSISRNTNFPLGGKKIFPSLFLLHLNYNIMNLTATLKNSKGILSIIIFENI